MGNAIGLKITSQEEEVSVKVREKLTISNLKTIIAKELKTGVINMRIKLANAELTGNMKLIDVGLKDGDIVEAEITKSEEQYALTMDKRGVEQHYAN